MRWTGLKKWSPTTCAGRRVAAAISVMLRDEVLEARMACSGALRSSSAKISSFTSMRSGTASITRSAWRTASSSEVCARSRLRASSASASPTLPVATPFSSRALISFMALSSCSRFMSWSAVA